MSRSRFVILSYHRVIPEPDPLRPGLIDVSTFRNQVSVLARFFNVVALRDIPEMLRVRRLPARAVVITFDDGYADNHEIALPVLAQFELPATFFIATGFMDGGMMWNDVLIESVRRCSTPSLDLRGMGLGLHPLNGTQARKAAIEMLIRSLKHREARDRARLVAEIRASADANLPDTMMMTPGQVVDLHKAGMEIGAHTVSHPILSVLSEKEAEEEIRRSKEHLERLLGSSVTSFAYPNGRPDVDYNEIHVNMVKNADFDVAVSTRPGFNNPDSSLYELSRIGPWDRSRSKFLLRMLSVFF